MYISEKSVGAAFSAKSGNCSGLRTGLEPSLGGVLREKAVWLMSLIALVVVILYMWHLILLLWSQQQVVAVLCDKMAIQ